MERPLGAGGVGAVYAATQLRTGRRYAVKVLLPEIAMKEGAAERFRREAEALAAVGHTGIVQIHDFDREDDGTQFLVMDLLEGEDLATRLARGGALPLPEALRVLAELGSALAAAHALGIVHRDLKPANVFLARRPGALERATILDFGLAKNLAGPSLHLTATGVGLGTPLYMSPEQARGEDVDLRSDVYSLGCILFEMLTGTAPFTGPSISVVIAKILTEEPPLVSERTNRPVPRALDEVVQVALAKSPGGRYATVQALLDAAHRAAAVSPLGDSDRALAETALVVTPTDPGLPQTRDALPLERAPETKTARPGEPLPSLRPAHGEGASTTDAARHARTATSTARPSVPPWMWAALGVLGTLALVGAVAIGRELGRDAGIERDGTSNETATTATTTAQPAQLRELDEPTTTAQTGRPVETTEAGEATASGGDAAPARPRARRGRPAAEPAAAPEPTTPAAESTPVGSPGEPPQNPADALSPAQRAHLASQSAAAVRAYDVQIAASDRRVQEYEAFLPDVLELRRQSRGVLRGAVPSACAGALRQRLRAAARGDESLAAAVATSLETALDPVCTAFESWAAPPSEVVAQLRAVGIELERGERMLDDAPSDTPSEELEVVRRALAALRRMHAAQPASLSRYPCRGPEVLELEQVSLGTQGWARAAADRPRRALERVCSAMGMSERRLSQLTEQLSTRTEAAEEQLRQGMQMHRDIATRLHAARAQAAAQSGAR